MDCQLPKRDAGAFLPSGLPSAGGCAGSKAWLQEHGALLKGWVMNCRGIEMFEIQGETKRHFGAFGLARAARGTAHPTVVGGVAPSLGAPHKHTHGWCSLEPVAGVRGGESQPTCTGHG